MPDIVEVKVKFVLKPTSPPNRTFFPCNMKRLGVLLLPPQDGMLVHRKGTLQHFIMLLWQFASTHIYSWVERGIVTVVCLDILNV